MIPPSNKLEKKKGDLKDYYSIRINDQWRIIFKWKMVTLPKLRLLTTTKNKYGKVTQYTSR